MHKQFAVAALAVVLGSASTAVAQGIILPTADTPSVPVPRAGVSMDLNAIDKSADPCQDFYQYACGNWQKNNPIPADKPRYGRFAELNERNLYSTYQLLETAANKPATPLQTKYGNFYAACMNQPLADQLGAKPLQPVLAQIAGLSDKKQLAALVGAAEAHAAIGFFYGFGSGQDQQDSTKVIPQLRQGGLGLPDRDYYLSTDAHSTTLRAKYVEHVTKMFTLLGDTPEQAAAEAKAVMTMETALAQGSMARVDLRDPAKRYHIMTLQQLDTLTPNYNWQSYFSALNLPVTSLNVSTPDYFKAMSAQIDVASIDDLKSYLRWHAVNSAASSLSQPFIDEDFAFNGAVLNGQKELSPLWRRCTQSTDAALGEAVGQDWVNANFPPSRQAKHAAPRHRP